MIQDGGEELFLGSVREWRCLCLYDALFFVVGGVVSGGLFLPG